MSVSAQKGSSYLGYETPSIDLQKRPSLALLPLAGDQDTLIEYTKVFRPVKLLGIACLTKSRRSSFLPVFQAQFPAMEKSNFTGRIFSIPSQAFVRSIWGLGSLFATQLKQNTIALQKLSF